MDARQTGTGYHVYVGTYTDGSSRGIHVCRFDAATGSLSEPRLAAETPNPTFLALHPRLPVLYAAGRPAPAAGAHGTVSAFAVDIAGGGLTHRATASSRGVGPCHLGVDPAGRFVLAANYHGGSVAVLPLGADGAVGKAVSFVQHVGHAAPHAHWIGLDPSGTRVLACDLGLDRVMVYDFDGTTGALAPHDPPWIDLPKGAGPRHLAFHRNGRVAYVINERDSTLAVLAWDARRGSFGMVQVLSTLPPGFSGDNATAEVELHPSGAFLYGSNRGQDGIAVWAVEEDGRLRPAGHCPSRGRAPRHFAVDPSGRWMIVANQDSGNLVVFRIDGGTGLPSPTGVERAVDKAVCVKYVPVRRSGGA